MYIQFKYARNFRMSKHRANDRNKRKTVNLFKEQTRLPVCLKDL